MTRAITFDVWETLITDPPELARNRTEARIKGMGNVLRRTGWRDSDEDLLKAYQASFEVYDRFWRVNLGINSDEQVKIILDLAWPDRDGKLDPLIWSDLVAAYVDPIFEFPPSPRDGVLDCLRAVKEQGFRLGLICNTGRTPGWAVRQLLASLKILDHFDVLAFSDEEGICKPDPLIFRRVIGALGVEPADAVHIGDNIITDIGGAKGVGMKAVLIGPQIPEGAPVAPDAHIVAMSDLVPLLPGLFDGQPRASTAISEPTRGT